MFIDLLENGVHDTGQSQSALNKQLIWGQLDSSAHLQF